MARVSQDAFGVLRGLQIVVEAVCREQLSQSKHLWANSSIRDLIEQQVKFTVDQLRAAGKEPSEELKKLQYCLQETSERSYVVAKGFQQLAETKVKVLPTCDFSVMSQTLNNFITPAGGASKNSSGSGDDPSPAATIVSGLATAISNSGNSRSGGAGSTGGGGKTSPSIKLADVDAANLDISTITLKELEEILTQRNHNRNISLRTSHTKNKQLPVAPAKEKSSDSDAKFTSLSDEAKGGVLESETTHVENVLKFVAGSGSVTSTAATQGASIAQAATKSPTPSPETKTGINIPELSKVAKQRRVPSSRIGRMASFGGLFAGLGIGTINELTKGALGLGGSTNMRDALLSPANAERIVDTLCKVRGAALKIGQILSIQDSKVVSPQLAKAFERVRQAADYMPDWQVQRVLNTQLGPEWRSKLKSFDDKPFAAASIGQVHRATLNDGMEVAIKIQYPGVAQSIESDIDNLVGMLKVWDVFPQGFFIDNVVRVAKRELNWEVDYNREAEYTEKFKIMIADYPEYYVPTVIRDLTTSSVLTTELVPGVPLDKCFDISYEHRKHIAESVLKLCLRELFEIECMQTDPNWSNFLYDEASKRLMLIDFGSTRFYQHQFIKNYRHVIICAANNDRQGVLEMSREMGFLTGYETKQMEKAHVDAVMILGEIFRYDGNFDFGKQNTTERLAQLVPTMVAHRLCPPPEEIYSIHRKLSGIFLLCARLNVSMNCRPFYDEIILKKFKE